MNVVLSSSSLELRFMHCVDHVSKVLEFLVGLNTWVIDVRGGAKVVNLGLAVHVSDGTALLC